MVAEQGITWAGLGIDLDLGYTHHLGQVAYQGTITPYKVHTQSVRLALKANPIKEILLDYNVYYGRNLYLPIRLSHRDR